MPLHDELTPETIQLAKETLKSMGLPTHRIEAQIAEYQECTKQIKEIKLYIREIMNIKNPEFIISRLLMEELTLMDHEERQVKIARIRLMLDITSI